jgi:hypothetical protein
MTRESMVRLACEPPRSGYTRMNSWQWLKMFGNVGPVLGALVLFGSWILQQSPDFSVVLF